MLTQLRDLFSPSLLAEIGGTFILARVLFVSPAKFKHKINSFFEWLQSPIIAWLLCGVLCIGTLIYFAIARTLLYQSFKLPVYDFGIYSQMLWKAAFNRPPDILFLSQKHWLGDHFQPIFYVLAPLAWIFPVPYVLLVLEPLAVAASGTLLYSLSIKHTRSILFSLALIFAYFFSFSQEIALFFPFHPSTLVGPLLIWTLWALDGKRWMQYSLAVILALMCKEDVGFYIGMLGLWIVIANRGRQLRSIGLATCAAGLVWSALAILVFIPHFRGAPYTTYRFDPALTRVHDSLIQTLLQQPNALWRVVATNRVKVSNIYAYLISFASLPLLSLSFLPWIPMFAERFLSNNLNYWIFAFHYGAPTVAALSYMALQGGLWWTRGTAKLLQVHQADTALYAQLVFTVLAVTIIWGTLNVNAIIGVHLFHFSEARHAVASPANQARQEAIKQVPRNASVLAQDALATALATRDSVMLLKTKANPNDWHYFLLDTSLTAWPLDTATIEQYIATYSHNPHWSLIYHKGTVYVFKNLAKP